MTVATLPATSPASPQAGALALDPGQIEWTEQQQAALSQLGVAEAPHGDLLVFLHYAQRTGLDPFAKQIYMIERWDSQAGRNKYTIQAGIEGLRVIAQRTRKYRGRLGPQWCGEDGVWRDMWPHRNVPPVAARVGVIHADHAEPTYAVAHFWEFSATKKNGDLTHMWATKSAHMIGKCAEAAALRAAFPHDLSGIYIPEETEQDDAPPSARPNTPGQTIRGAMATPAEPRPAPEAQTEATTERMISGAQQKRMGALMREHGITDRGSALALVNEVLQRPADQQVTSRNELTLDEASKVIDALDGEANKDGGTASDGGQGEAS